MDFTDVTALAPNLGKTVSNLATPNFALGAESVAASPEPGSLALLALGGLLAMPRRRSRG